jgi:hypothetical protein
LKDTTRRASVSSSKTFNGVIPAWTAGIQIDMEVSAGILTNLDAGNPCRHDSDLIFYFPVSEIRSEATLWWTLFHSKPRRISLLFPITFNR